MPYGGVSAVRCVPGDGDRSARTAALLWGGARRVVSRSRRGSRFPLVRVPVVESGICVTGGTPTSPAAAAGGPDRARWRSGGCARCCSATGGFTPCGARDPEAVRELLSEYSAAAGRCRPLWRVVEVHRGCGDGGLGHAGGDRGDAERAVRAALDLVAAVGQLGGEAGVRGLAARAGWSRRGGGHARRGGRGGPGDAVNTAARVQTAADPGRR